MVGHVLLHPSARIGLFVAVACLSFAPLGISRADKVMRVGMTASDIPTTGGIERTRLRERGVNLA
jgi:hypothetical protein